VATADADIAARTVVAATDYELSANRTAFTVVATGPGLAVLTEGYSPGDFRVTVNGQPAECLRVNHAFRGVKLDAAGTYRIAMVYDPPAWHKGLHLAGGGLGLMVVLALGELLGRRRAAARAAA
jgi:hypothetical protein